MQAAKFVNGYLDAWNHFDAHGVVAYLSNQGIYFDRSYDEKYSRPALTRYLYELFEREKQQYQLDGDILVGESTIAYKYRALDLNSPGSKPAEYGAEFLSLKGDKITNIEVFYSTSPNHYFAQSPSSADTTNHKYEKSGLGPHQAEAYKARLLELMEVDKLFLSAELTLPMLAKAMGCTVNHVSQVINGNLSTSFYDLINSYRIAEAKKLLLEDMGGRSFVLNISNQVGFNSNSAFYTAFKKDCQLTPLQYRRSKLGE